MHFITTSTQQILEALISDLRPNSYRTRMGLCTRSLVCAIVICMMNAVVRADDTCDSTLPFTPNFNMTGFKCQVTWDPYNYIIRSVLDNNILSVVVSAKQNNQWVALGFSETGMMVGSTAMVAWKDPNGGSPLIYEYYLQQASPEGVVRSNDTLTLLTTPMAVLDDNGTLYMAFQADLSNSSAKAAYTLYAIGPEDTLPGANDVLPHHSDTQVLPGTF